MRAGPSNPRGHAHPVIAKRFRSHTDQAPAPDYFGARPLTPGASPSRRTGARNDTSRNTNVGSRMQQVLQDLDSHESCSLRIDRHGFLESEDRAGSDTIPQLRD